MSNLPHSLPGYDTWKLASPPSYDGYPDEPCQNCGGDLDDSSFEVRDQGYFCQSCVKPIERCDQCHFVRCTCEDDR